MVRLSKVVVILVLITGCSNPFSSEEKIPLLPNIWFITQQGIGVMSEKPDTMIALLNINTDSLGILIDAGNRTVQTILRDSLGYQEQYLLSPDLRVLFAGLEYINQWHLESERAKGVYIRVEKVAVTNLWWELDAFDKFNGDNTKGFLYVSRWTLIHELVHYYQQRAGKEFSECEADMVREYFFYGSSLNSGCP